MLPNNTFGGNDDMTRDEFIQAKTFIFLDIEREIQLAKAHPAALQVGAGRGQFPRRLWPALLHRVWGKLRFNVTRNGKDVASANFNQFWDLLGAPYQAFRARHDVYDIFRCGLAHEYYVKKSCTIAILEGSPGGGLRVDGNGHYWVIVESYCRDLKKAFHDLQIRLYGS